MTKSQTKDVLWHGGKALLCSFQLWFIGAAGSTVASMDYFIAWLVSVLMLPKSLAPILALLHPLLGVTLFIALWRYYDSIDDRSFNQFCARCREGASAPLLRDLGFQAGIAVTVLTATPVLAIIFRRVLMGLRLGASPATAVSIALSATAVIGLSLLRIRSLEETWQVQKDLPNQSHKLSKRILNAIVFFVALALLLNSGVLLAVYWLGFFFSVLQLMFQNNAVPVLLVIILPFLVIRTLRAILKRRKFMKRLAKLQTQGELTYTVDGHPYLSVLFPKLARFGLNIIDAPHADAKRKEYRAYTVAVITTRHRKGTVILCDHNVYRFMYALNLRGIGGFRVGANLLAGAQIVAVPAGAWYTNHAFDFPEGDGEKILLVDPAPRVLAIHGQRADELIPQDNASKLYGYTVYGKNSFLNMLERT